ncbi:MAG: hypothetical protein ALECFALPRED_005891 [Alectoria fallacina]|uniref:Uncharacterized protein n=1 Tax=Alectoria fallacina TaxID=1903189 RepID=A0A8H3G0A7_9LECA|nr:MAG: hypothetical protein ALECFALPRED_005891 [Alectoria fallacina]
MNISQQADWGNNVYLLTTTRILMVLGLAYPARSFYQLSHILARDLSVGLYREDELHGRHEKIGCRMPDSSHGSGHVAVAEA